MWTKEQLRWMRIGGWMLFLILALAFLIKVRSIFPLFLLGFFIAYLLDPLADRLEARGWSRKKAAGLVFGIFIILIVWLTATIGSIVFSEAIDIANGLKPGGDYYKLATKVIDWVERNVKSEHVPGFVRGALEDASKKLGQFLQVKLMGLLSSAAGLLNLFVLIFITYYFLLTFDPFVRQLVNLIPEQYRHDTVSITQEAANLVGRYIRGYVVMCVCVGIVDTVLLYIVAFIFKMKYALVIGALAGATYAIPIFGSLFTSAIAAAIAWATSNNPLACTIAVLLVLFIVNMVFDYGITPRAVGSKIGLTPLGVIFAVMAGGVLFGVLGMLVAVPVAGSIKLLLSRLLPQVFAPPTPEPQRATVNESMSQ